MLNKENINVLLFNTTHDTSTVEVLNDIKQCYLVTTKKQQQTITGEMMKCQITLT